MPRAAAQIRDEAALARRLGEPIEEVAIQRLLRELSGDALEVLVGELVVALAVSRVGSVIAGDDREEGSGFLRD